MNYIDVAPEMLAMFIHAVEQNRNLAITGTQHGGHYCRFTLDVAPVLYDGPPCQWTCEVSIDTATVTTTFKPCELGR